MKVRTGFVSNSSSSSFVVSLKGLDESKIRDLKRLVAQHNSAACEGHLTFGKNFIYGEIEQGDDSGLVNYLKANVDKDNWEG